MIILNLLISKEKLYTSILGCSFNNDIQIWIFHHLQFNQKLL